MADDTTLKILQSRFWQLKDQIDLTEAKSGPIRAERDRVIAEHRKVTEMLEDQIKTIEKDLFENKQELSMIVKALRDQETGKAVLGPRPAAN